MTELSKNAKVPQCDKTAVITGALISMTNFVLNVEKSDDYKNWKSESDEWVNRCVNYANFLKEPITLGMFVPTDKNGIPFKGKPLSPNTDAEWIRWENEQEEFYKAKELVLFANFEVKTKKAFNNGYDFVCDNNEIFYPFWYNPVTGWELSKGLKTIEDLVIFQPKLTDNVLSEYFS